MSETIIIAISSSCADVEAMRQETEERTGDYDPFFCPEVEEGKPFIGHVHVIPAHGAIGIINQLINMDEV